MATSEVRDTEHEKKHAAINTPPIVSEHEWEGAPAAPPEREGHDPLP